MNTRILAKIPKIPKMPKIRIDPGIFGTFEDRVWRPFKRFVGSIREYLGRREVFPWVFTWAICAVIGFSLLEQDPAKVAASVCAVVVLAFITYRVDLGIVLLIFLCASFFEESIIPAPITFGGHGFSSAELIVFFLILVVGIKALINGEFELFGSPMTFPVLMFIFAVLISVLVAYYNPEQRFYFNESFNTARTLFYYLFFFVPAFGIRNMRQFKTVLHGLMILTAFLCLLMALQYIVGSSHSLFIGSHANDIRVESLTEEDQDITRSLPPGIFCAPFLFMASMLLSCFGDPKKKGFYTITCSLIGAGIIFSFTRNLWVFTAFAIVVCLVLATRQMRRKLSVFMALILLSSLIGSILLAGLAPGKAGTNFTSALVKRISSVFDREKLANDASLQNRIDEDKDAWAQIKRHPVFGIGVGSPIRYKIWINGRHDIQFVRYPVNMMHNSYLELWLVYGLFGVIAFAWMLITVMVRSFILFRISDDMFVKSFALAVFTSMVVYMLTANMAMTYLHTTAEICITACMWGLLEALWRVRKQGTETAPEPEKKTVYRGIKLLLPRAETRG